MRNICDFLQTEVHCRCHFLYLRLCLVRQIAEEVYLVAKFVLQFGDGNDISLQRIVAMIYVGVLKPESEAGIHVESGTLPHHGSIEILRNYHLAADTLQDMVLAVYRTALAYEEGVAGGELCS